MFCGVACLGVEWGSSLLFRPAPPKLPNPTHQLLSHPRLLAGSLKSLKLWPQTSHYSEKARSASKHPRVTFLRPYDFRTSDCLRVRSSTTDWSVSGPQQPILSRTIFACHSHHMAVRRGLRTYPSIVWPSRTIYWLVSGWTIGIDSFFLTISWFSYNVQASRRH